MNLNFIFQDNETSRGWLSEGSSPVFKPEVIEDLKNENIYQYQENNKAQESLWDLFWNWVERSLNRIFDSLFNLGKPGWWGTFVEVLPYLVIGLVIALLVYLFFKNNPLRKPIKTTYKDNEVLLHNLSSDERKTAIDDLIKKAKKEQNYQLLIRYQYIQILDQLDQLKCIKFKSDKTNSDYFYELNSSVFLEDFKQLTYYYEYAWYGDFNVNEQLYAKYKNSLSQLHQLLNQKHG